MATKKMIDQPHAVTIALQPQPVAVVLHLVEPVRDDGRSGREAEFKHAAKVVIGAGFANRQRKRAQLGVLGPNRSPALPLGKGTYSTGDGTECSGVERDRTTGCSRPAKICRQK